MSQTIGQSRLFNIGPMTKICGSAGLKPQKPNRTGCELRKTIATGLDTVFQSGAFYKTSYQIMLKYAKHRSFISCYQLDPRNLLGSLVLFELSNSSLAP